MPEQLMTPSADARDKRLSWSRLVQNLRSNSSVDSYSADDASDTGSISFPDPDSFFDPSEEALCKDVVRLIALHLTQAKDDAGVLHCSRLLIPGKLLEHIGQELEHLSASEPCGLRGALIDLCVERGGRCEAAGQIAVDSALVPTFHLTLVLRLDSGGIWPRLQGFLSGRTTSTALRLGTGFRVMKRKLYSSEELLIEEC